MNNEPKKQIKKLNLNTKQSCFFAKSIAVLSLSFVLQGRSCQSGSGIQDRIVKTTTNKEFCDEIGNKKDISIPDRETGKNWLYTAVSYNQLEKVKHILKRIDEDIASSFEYKNKDFANIYHKKSNKTALGIAIEKGYTEIVKQLVANKHIDINKAKKGSTPLLEALLHKKEAIAAILLNYSKTDICTKDATSDSSPLHLAIEQKYQDIALSLINKLDQQGLKEKNKQYETPLHLVIEHNLDHLVKLLVNRLSAVADLCAQDKKGRTPLHMAVRDNHTDVFQVVFHRIEHLCNDKSTSISKLFEKDKEGRSVFARACLPKHTTQRWVGIFENNVKMFESILSTVENNLATTDWESIANEINGLWKKGTIKEEYKDKLLKIVDRYRSAQNIAIGV
ncbi:ankyrin repeat domain-containing protein [Candidatus Cardinium hertigii]|uniref:ankyrin repeat domain-containing protein n=1 Tax=Candidatus Cardinium hertigii TaxID=247481 RepID=UPI003D7E7788